MKTLLLYSHLVMISTMLYAECYGRVDFDEQGNYYSGTPEINSASAFDMTFNTSVTASVINGSGKVNFF
jgi:hypothetical protein